MSARPMRDIQIALYDKDEHHRFRSDAFEVYVDGRLYVWNHSQLPATPSKRMVDDDGENTAVRAFLALYGGQPGVSIGSMRSHMRLSGWDRCWPAWADDTNGHLTKAMAQDWIRYLFELEQGGEAKA